MSSNGTIAETVSAASSVCHSVSETSLDMHVEVCASLNVLFPAGAGEAEWLGLFLEADATPEGFEQVIKTGQPDGGMILTHIAPSPSARRAAACINACRGISTEELEAGKFALTTGERWSHVFTMDRLAAAVEGLASPEVIAVRYQDVVATARALALQSQPGAFASYQAGKERAFAALFAALPASAPTSMPTMRLIEFHPGEGSRFFVGAARLSAADAQAIGGGTDTVFVFFGTEHPSEQASHWFVANPKTHTILAYEYLKEKLQHLHPSTLQAAHHVVADLLGREAFDAKYSPETLEWSADWREQLAPLRAITLVTLVSEAGSEIEKGDTHVC